MSSLALYPDDGKKVLDFLRKFTGVKLPKTGLVAGQAVCSALMYLKGQDRNVHINDIDIFVHCGPVPSSGIYPFIPHHELPQLTHTFASTIRGESERRKAQRQSFIQESMKSRLSNNASHDDYHQIVENAEALFPRRERTFLHFYESNALQGYRILGAYRRGIKNIVLTSSGSSFRGPKQGPSFLDFQAKQILNGFDMNCVQVGVDLASEQMFYTPEFVGFLHSKTLRILRMHRPWHTVVRYFRKKEEHGYYGNDDLTTALASTYHDLRQPELLEDLIDLEPQESTASQIRRRTFDIPRFGEAYIDKLDLIRHDLKGIFDLRIDRVKIRKKTDEKFKDSADKMPDFTKLGSLIPRQSGVGKVLGGSHRRSVERRLGAKISNYPGYARTYMIPIIEEHFGVHGKRLLARRDRIALSGVKFNTRTPHARNNALVRSLNDRPDRLRGNITLKGIELVGRLMDEHREIRRRLLNMEPEDQIRFSERFRWLEKHHPNLAYHVLHSKIIITDAEFIHSDMDEMTVRIKESYQRWFEEEMKKPPLVDSEFDDMLLPDTKVRVTELTRAGLLIDEGIANRHCVGGYSSLVKNGFCRILSFREDVYKRSTAELEYIEKDDVWFVTQYRGRNNKRPKGNLSKALDEWISILSEKGLKIKRSD